MNKRPLHTARIAAAEIDDGSWGGRGRDRALVQLARDWRAWPSHRDNMVNQTPSPDTDPTTFAKVAAVVHFLCLHDHIAAPAWTQGHKADPEVMLFDIPLHSRYGQQMQQTAPAVCAAYGVYFTWNLLDLWRGRWTLAAEPDEAPQVPG